ncbi:MAG TPA: DUF4229 domain-containing protein [Nocardioidaceae bacterium]|nr:DUF4229 domain-containing protein [Nocardioidaceae bacterium]
MKEFAIYTAARLGLFLVSYVLVIGVYLLVSDSDTIPVFWPFLLAVIMSAIGSVYLLRRQREDFARTVQARAERAAARRRMVEAEQDRAAEQGRPEDQTGP